MGKDLSLDSAHTSVAVEVNGTENQAEHLVGAGTLTTICIQSSAYQYPASNLPTSEELQEDTKKLAGSATRLFTLVFTSSTFRALLQDFFVSTREILSSTAATVSHTAGQVQIAAEKIEYLADPNHGPDPTQEQVSAAINEAGKNSAEAFIKLEEGSTEAARSIAINRIQGVSFPHSCDALILTLLLGIGASALVTRVQTGHANHHFHLSQISRTSERNGISCKGRP